MRFTALELGTADLQRARQFWTETMGLRELSATPSSVTWQVGTTAWTLTQAATPPAIAHFAFNIPENRFDEAIAWLRQRAPLLTEPEGRERFAFSDWDAHAVYFPDPDGNIAELIARHTLLGSRRESLELLSISEIGLVVDDVPTAAAQLGLPSYRPGHASFRPMGDEEGLVIVVPRERPWYPDNRHPAQPVAWKLTLADGRVLEGLPDA